MRKIALALLMMPLACFAQKSLENIADSTKKYVKLIKDEISGESYYQSENIIAETKSGEKISIFFLAPRSKEAFSVNFKDEKLVCSEKSSPMLFLLDDDIRVEMKNYQKYNCDGDQAFVIPSHGLEVSREFRPDAGSVFFPMLKTKAFRLKGANYRDYYFSELDGERFRITYRCFEKMVGVLSSDKEGVGE